MNLHLPQLKLWGHKGGRSSGAVATRLRSMSYSETVAPLDGQHRIGFVMLSTLAQDERRMGEHHGALPRRGDFLAGLQSKDLQFVELRREVGMYFIDRTTNSQYRAMVETALGQLDYILLFAVSYEPMAGNSNILQDTLKPRLYNNKGQLVKRLEECYWSDQAVERELHTFIDALARAIRMELRAIIRRVEALV